MNDNHIKSFKICLSVIVILISIFFLFFRLGHYALWDDEAICALFGKSLWQNGDTSALLDHNIIAFNWGRELKNLHMRYIPPLQFYISAPWAAYTQGSAFMVRFPFAFIGLCSILLILIWMHKSNLSLSSWMLMGMGLLGNTSLFLYFRHCRYYSPAIFFTLLLLYLYWHRKNSFFYGISCAIIGIFLFASNYLCFVSAAFCFLLDYLIWGRREKPINAKTLITVLIPLGIGAALIFSQYNPIGMNVWGINTPHIILFKITLFLWNLRDLNACEFGVGILILLSIAIGLGTKQPKFLRGPVTIIFYCLITAIFSPQPDGGLRVANVRYLAPLIPLCIYVSVMALEYLCQKPKWLVWPLAIIAFGTNLFHGGSFVGVDRSTDFSVVLPKAHVKSSVYDFVQELIDPHPSAFRLASDWVNNNVEGNESIWVVPTYMNYPLIFHAPKAIYAWQLLEKEGQFKNLPDIHFFNKIPPDYIMAFGPIVKHINDKIQEFEEKNISYKQIAVIDAFWYDLIRAELYWHSFKEIQNYSKETQAIYIYKRINH